jgi:hypothetical protein
MVNIFGIKLFENSSIEEQMHHKGRKHNNRRHGKTCNCHMCHKRKQYTRKHYKGGYRYNEKKKGLSMGEDVTMSLMSQTNSKTRTKRRRHN